MKTQRLARSASDEVIISKIFFVRGCKVMLDQDLAGLYGVKTKVLNQAVKRNPDRFPSHYMFRLTEEEQDSLRSQIVTLKRGEHSKYLSYEMLSTHKDVLLKLETLEKNVSKNNKEIQYIFSVLKQLLMQPGEPRKRIGLRRSGED